MPDALTFLRSDHRNAEKAFVLFDATEDAGTRIDLVHRIIHALSIHAAIEEERFYPRVREAPGGDGLIDESMAQHQAVKELLAALDGMEANDPELVTTVHRLRDEVTEHVQLEETTVFPAIAGILDESTLFELGEQLEKAAAHAPTRPHPHAPAAAPLNLPLNCAAAVVDKLRDTTRST
jgi:hemerythrin superfamily protein